MADGQIPTLFEWAGGEPALRRWLDVFYDDVEKDDLLSPVFHGAVSEHHRSNVTDWWCEALGGPALYTQQHGGHPAMTLKHVDLAITAEQRLRFTTLMSRALDTAGLPADPEFRAAFMGYVEWATRAAVLNSQPGADVFLHGQVKRWGWGEAPPYRP